MMQDEQCEGCLCTDDSQHSILCANCVDKAASYDITLRDKRFLYRGVKAIDKPLKEAQSVLQRVCCEVSAITADKVLLALRSIGECVGRVDVMIDDCAPSGEQKGE
jgi:hypothetical protein